MTCLSWAPSVTEGSRLLNQGLSTIWLFLPPWTDNNIFGKITAGEKLSHSYIAFIIFTLLFYSHSLFILFSYFLALNGWMDKAGMPEACGPLASHEQITETTAPSSKLFCCSRVRRWVPLAYREELNHVLRLSGPLVSPLFVPCLFHVLHKCCNSH